MGPNTTSNQSNVSVRSTTSVAARKRRLELRTAEERIKIQREAIEKKIRLDLELIDRRLEAELTEVEEDEVERDFGVEQIPSSVGLWLQSHNAAQQDENMGELGRTAGLERHDPEPPGAAVKTTLEKVVRDLDKTVDTLRQQAATSGSGDYLVRRLTSTKQLPKFDGNSLGWLRFKRSFDLTSELGNYSEAENVARLFSCLEGEARKWSP